MLKNCLEFCETKVFKMSYRSNLLPKLREQLIGQGMNEVDTFLFLFFVTYETGSLTEYNYIFNYKDLEIQDCFTCLHM